MKLSTRLWLIVATAITGLLLLTGSFLWTLDSSMRSGRSVEIENMLVSARNMVDSYAQMEKDGKLSRADAQMQALRGVSSLRAGTSVYYFVRTPDGMMLAHPDPKIVGTVSTGRTTDGRLDYDAWRQSMDSRGISIISIAFKKPGETAFSEKLNGVAEFRPWGWWIGTGFFTDDITAEFFRAARSSLLAVILVIAGLCLMAYRLIRSVTRSIGGEPSEVAELAQRIADGDLSIGRDRVEREAMRADPGSQQANLASSMVKMRDALRRTIEDIQGAAGAIAVGTAEMPAGNDDLSRRTEQQAAALEQTAASVEELNATVQQNAQSVSQANNLTKVGVTAVSSGDKHILEIVSRMTGITDSAERMRGLVEVVSGIAAQTNDAAVKFGLPKLCLGPR